MPPIIADTLVEDILDLPGAIDFCIRNGVSPFTCSGDFPCSLGKLLELRRIPDPEAFIAGLNALAAGGGDDRTSSGR